MAAVGDVVFVLGVIILVTSPIWMSWLINYLRARPLLAARAGVGIEQFVSHFAREGIPDMMSREVYRYLETQAPAWHFPVLPEDNLRDVYGLGRFGGSPLPEVLDDLLIFCGCRRLTPEEMGQIEWPATVEELVRLLYRYRM